MATARYLLENLGFVVNFDKSCFVPTQQLEFLGFLVNSRDMTLLLPDCESGGNKSPLSLPASTSRRICPGVVSAHRETDGIHTGHISGSLALPISAAPETPSSSSAKRVRCNNSSVKPGLWSQMERTLHINCLELLAGSFAVKSFVNRLGGTRSLVLSNLALALWEWALSQNIFLSAEHLAGRMNVMADWQSRHFTDSSNWRLCPEVFQALMQIREPCAKDLFADRLNTQLSRFYSWKPDPMALAVDALQQDWSKEKNYAFPPFCLITRVLAKSREFGGELILITPLWPTQAWYPTLLDMSVSLPVLLLMSNNLLLGPQGEIHPLILNTTLQLAAWHVSNAPCSRRAFVQTLPSSSWQLGGQAQTQFITPPGRNGIAGVSDGRLIHFAPLWQI